MFGKVSRKSTKRCLRKGRELLKDLRYKTSRLRGGFLFFLIPTIRIHSEVSEVSIRKWTSREVVLTIWSQNGCQ